MKEQKIIMEKQMENKKKVLIDLTNYGSIAVGFGQIAVNYAALFASLPIDDIHFIYLMRKRSVQDFGENVTCIPVRRINKLFPFTLPKVDVWHAVNQQRKLARVAKGTKFIFTIHDFNFLKEKKPWKVKLYLRRMQHKIDKAAVVTAISHYTADIVRQHVNMREKRFVLSIMEWNVSILWKEPVQPLLPDVLSFLLSDKSVKRRIFISFSM